MQERLKECQSTFERKLSALQEKVTAISCSKSSKSVENSVRVTKDLTVMFAVDYFAFEEFIFLLFYIIECILEKSISCS